MRSNKSQWRTWSGILALGAMMDFALWICAHTQQGPALFPAACGCLLGLGGFLAAKAAVEHGVNAKATAAAQLAQATTSGQ